MRRHMQGMRSRWSDFGVSTRCFEAASHTWDVSLDSQHFLMAKFGERKPNPVTEMVLVQNWFEELKRLAPTSRK